MGAIRYLQHTADAGAEITAASREELFVLGARALYKLILDYDAVEPSLEREFEIIAADFGDLFHDWLAELLYRLDTEGLVFRQFSFAFAADGSRLRVTARGEELDGDKHHPHGEIKNVTYCDFAVEERDGGFVARVIFDL